MIGATDAAAQRGPNFPNLGRYNVAGGVRPTAGVPYDPRPKLPGVRSQVPSPTVGAHHDMYLRLSERVVQIKYCTACGATVPYHTSHNGQLCPNCRVHWGAPGFVPQRQPRPIVRGDEQIAADPPAIEHESKADNQPDSNAHGALWAGLLETPAAIFLEGLISAAILIAAAAALRARRMYRRVVRI